MKQFLNELNEHMGRMAYVVEGPDEASLYVYPQPEYDFLAQVCIEYLFYFCRAKQLQFYVSFGATCIVVYKPELYINACKDK